MLKSRRSAFTILELLCVVAIISLLIGLLLPAIQKTREAASRIKCANHIKQSSLACLNHETTYGFLPSGGWGYSYLGQPDKGAGAAQPGGWIYSILPFIEQ